MSRSEVSEGYNSLVVPPGPSPTKDNRKLGISIVVPTYREAGTISAFLERVEAAAPSWGAPMELLVMDDDSGDGIESVIEQCQKSWVRLAIRRTDRGLSQAVLAGFDLAQYDILVVMDADLSHPPEVIEQLVHALESGADMAVGSRYIAGGSTDAAWGFSRWLKSRVATVMARPFARIGDPMSGFFALRRATFEGAHSLNPIGYKIALELIVKCPCQDICEVPINFIDRRQGQSKLGFLEHLKYVQHIRRLAIWRYPNITHLLQFLLVGASGVVVNLLMLSLLLALGLAVPIAVAVAITVSMLSNFILHRQFAFPYARSGSVQIQLLRFSAACGLGAILNYAVTLSILGIVPGLLPQFAALSGIGAATTINYLTNRYLVFRKNDGPR